MHQDFCGVGKAFLGGYVGHVIPFVFFVLSRPKASYNSATTLAGLTTNQVLELHSNYLNGHAETGLDMPPSGDESRHETQLEGSLSFRASPAPLTPPSLGNAASIVGFDAESVALTDRSKSGGGAGCGFGCGNVVRMAATGWKTSGRPSSTRKRNAAG
jgi:hypothetical protein